MISESQLKQTGSDTQLKSLFTDQLQELYWSEKKLAKIFIKMQEAALNQDLALAFLRQHEQTREQITRIENIFQSISEEPHKSKSPVMAGILSEVKLVIDDMDEKSHISDVALIMVAQQAKHFEIASYGCLAELARTMGLEEASSKLSQNLQEEKQADTLLTLMAVRDINLKASGEPESSIQHRI
jgi:ferritin-like metal-binding protein YciE